MVLYKININSVMDNIYFDSVNNWIYFKNTLNNTFGFNVLNEYNYNTDNYNSYNYFIIEILKLYDDNKRSLFEQYIKNCIKNNNLVFCLFNGVNFTIHKTNLDIKDFKIVY